MDPEQLIARAYETAESLRPFALRSLRGDSDYAGEVLQSALLDFIVRVREGAQIYDVKGYFGRILRHRIGDEYKRWGRSPLQLEPMENDRDRDSFGGVLTREPASPDPDPEAQLLEKERVELMTRARMELDDIDQAIVTRHLDGEPNAKTQRVLSIDDTFHRNHKHRAKRAMRDYLRQQLRRPA